MRRGAFLPERDGMSLERRIRSSRLGPRGAQEYRRHLHNGSHDALVNLAEPIDTVSTYLLCVEESHETCHRSVIAGAVAERLPRVAIVHL
jgi:Protein of unknown function, DUF488